MGVGRVAAGVFRRPWLLAVLGVVLVLGVTQWLRVRPDPAAVPGVKRVAVLLLQSDAQITAMTGSQLNVRAERAALVRSIWEEPERTARLNRALAGDESLTPGGAGDAAHPAVFLVTRWGAVSASAHRADAQLVGHYRLWQDGAWHEQADRSWTLALAREDPVGITRGWHLVSIS